MPTANQRVLQLLRVEQILEPQILSVDPNTTVAVVVERLCKIVEQTHSSPETDLDLPTRIQPSCALIVAHNHLLGIFTGRDLVRLLAEDTDLESVAISTVMTQPVVTISQADANNIFTVLTTLKQHQIRHLPVVDDGSAVQGVITQASIQRAMQPLSFLKLRRVGEVMTRAVIQAEVTATLLELAQKMTQSQVSYVVLTEAHHRGGLALQVPKGLVQSQDLLQFRNLGLSLAQTLAHSVISAPLSRVSPQDTLWFAHQQMQKYHTRRLVVTDEAGGLAGIVKQTDLLQILDPMEMLADIEQLQQLSEVQTTQLNQANRQLQQINQGLQTEIAERRRLEEALHHANQLLEERVGLQAAQLVQTDEALKQEMRKRRRVQEQLERFFSVTPSLLCIAGLDGYFKQLNPNFVQALGYDAAELLREPFINFVHPDDRGATQAEMTRLAAGELTIAFENRYRCKGGSYRWLSWNATADLEEQIIYAAARDVTEGKQLEAVLRRERDFTAAILNTVGALVVVLDQGGRVIRFNRTCEQVSGYLADEISGKAIWDVLIPLEERDAVRTVFQQLREARAPNQYENYWLRKDGQRKLIRWSNTVLKDAASVVEYVIGTGIDVTNQRQVEQNLARQYQQGQLLGEITRKIRESLQIDDILQTAVTEVRKLLACDRVVVIECHTNKTGTIIQESVRSAKVSPSLLNRQVLDLKLMPQREGETRQVCVCQDLKSLPCSLYAGEFWQQCQVRSCIEVAIYVGNQLWGLITASQRDQPHQWDTFEIELMQQLANQMGVAISQAQFLENLEAQVQQRTNQLIQTNHQLRWEIQERIQIESALRENRQKLEGILDNADEAIISIDSQQQIVLYNRGAERIFGYAFDEAYHQPLDMLLPEAYRQIHRQHVDTFAASSDSSRQIANRRRHVLGQRKSGESFPAEASISKLRTKTGPLFTVILKDITEQRQSEAALQRSAAQLQMTTNALPALICSVDTEQRYCFNNQTYEDWFNIPVAELRGRYIWEVMGDAYYAQVQPHIQIALSGQQVKFEAEVTIPDGRSRYVLATYIPEVDEAGNIKGFFGLMTDISDRKATERLKDEFVSVVGHELRTPLTSIHGSLKLLATQRLGILEPQGQEILAIALKNTERLTRLINDVLDLERIESGRMALELHPHNLAELMVQAAQAMQTMADTHGVNLSVTPLEATLWVDPDHMTQALTNLLSNAIKFSPVDATVWLKAIDRETDVMLYVKDQGRGIPSDKLEKVFERFQQVDASDSRQRGGTGLGLAICKRILQQHGGKIWAESTLGHGSTFFLTLPKAQPPHDLDTPQ